MKLEELGHQVRRSRTAHALTQQQLAREAGVSRTTVNLLENGLLPDISLSKASAILARLGLSLKVERQARPPKANYLKIASTSASTRSRRAITETQLRRVFLTGKVPKEMRSQVRDFLEEAAPEMMRGLIRDLRTSHPPGKIERNLERIALELEISQPRVAQWLSA